MAARYLNGTAIPETTILNNISNWLMCDAWWLLYGSKKNTKEVSNEISKEIFKFIFNEMRGLIEKKSATIMINLLNVNIEFYHPLHNLRSDRFGGFSAISGISIPFK